MSPGLLYKVAGSNVFAIRGQCPMHFSDSGRGNARGKDVRGCPGRNVLHPAMHGEYVSIFYLKWSLPSIRSRTSSIYWNPTKWRKIGDIVRLFFSTERHPPLPPNNATFQLPTGILTDRDTFCVELARFSLRTRKTGWIQIPSPSHPGFVHGCCSLLVLLIVDVLCGSRLWSGVE